MEDTSNFIEKMLELGIGVSMVRQIPGIMDMAQPLPSQPPAEGWGGVSQSGAQTYLVEDGAQAGPFSDDELLRLISGGILLPTTLVWKLGLDNWSPASSVPSVNKLFLLAKLK